MRYDLIVIFGFLAATPVLAQEPLDQYVRDQVLGGRYMSPAGGCKPATQPIANWAASELQECVYPITDHWADGSRHAKAGLVFLANPPPERVLAWLKTGCARAQPNESDECVRVAALAIRGASGAQFPVAGVVWEDQACGDPHGKCQHDRDGHPVGDGVNEAYVFRNGVTVAVADFVNGSTAPIDLGDTLRELALTREITGVKAAGGYARISSTTRETFQRYTGREDVPVGQGSREAALTWTRIVGETYQAALRSDENPLISAWLCADKGWPQACVRH